MFYKDTGMYFTVSFSCVTGPEQQQITVLGVNVLVYFLTRSSGKCWMEDMHRFEQRRAGCPLVSQVNRLLAVTIYLLDRYIRVISILLFDSKQERN